MADKELLIIPIIKSEYYYFKSFFGNKPIQNKKFKFGIKIKNLGNSPINSFGVKDIKIYEKTAGGFCLNCLEEYKIGMINPKEVRKIWFDNKIFPESGQVIAELVLESNEKIQTYQYDIANEEEAKHKVNSWMNFIHILDEHIYHQKIMNWTLIALTFLTALPLFIKLIQYLITQYF